MESRLSVPLIAVAQPSAARRRLEDGGFWTLKASDRVRLMRAGRLTMSQCCAWAARAPHEVPIVNGEYEFIAMFTAEVTECLN